MGKDEPRTCAEQIDGVCNRKSSDNSRANIQIIMGEGVVHVRANAHVVHVSHVHVHVVDVKS